MNPQELAFILKMHDEASATLKKIGQSLKGMGDEASDTTDDNEKLGNSFERLKKVATDATVAFAGFATSAMMVRGASSAWGDYEMGLVGVVKTTNLAGRELAEFRSGIDDLATRMNGVPVNTLFELAEAAGQMGVAKENLIEYTEVMGQLQIATDVVGSEGASSIGRLLKITKEGDQQIRRFGDTLVYLGNSTAATESEILKMATSIAQRTAGMNMTSDALLGLAAAAKQFGLQDELTASASGRTLRNIYEGAAQGTQGFQNFLRVANMTREEFEQLKNEHPEQILLRFAESYKALQEGGGASGFLATLGLNTDEVKAVMGVLGDNIEEAQKKLADAQSTQADGAAQREAENFFNAYNSKVEAAKTAWDQVKTAIGEALSPVTFAVLDGVAATFNGIAAIVRGLPGPIKTAFALIGTALPALLGLARGFALIKAAAVAIKGSAIFGPMVAHATRLFGVVRPLISAFLGFGTLGKVFAVVRTAIMAVTAALAGLVSWPALIVAAVVAAAIAIIANWDKVRAFLNLSFSEMGTVLKDAIINAGKAAFGWLTDAWDGFMNWIKGEGEAPETGSATTSGRKRAPGEIARDVQPIRFLSAEEQEVVKALDAQYDRRKKIAEQERALATVRKMTAEELKANELSPDAVQRLENALALEKARLDPLRDAIRSVQDEIALAGDMSAAQRQQIELQQRIRDVAEETGASYSTVAARVGGLVRQLNAVKAAAAMANLMRDFDDQLAAAQAVTGEQRRQVELEKQIRDLKREHNITSEQEAQIRRRSQEVFHAERQTAYGNLIRDTEMQLSSLRATTQQGRDYLDVVQQIANFERERGVLYDDQRLALAQQLMLVKQLNDFQRLADQYDPVGTARRKYEEERRTLEVMRQQKVITEETYARMSQNLEERTRGSRDPVGERVRSLREELSVLQMSIEVQGRERTVLEEVNSLRQAGVNVSREMTDAIRDYAQAMEDYELASTSGLGGFVNSVGTVREGLMDLTKDFATGLSGAVAGILKGDKGAFSKFLVTLGGKMVDWGVNQLTAQMFKGLGATNPQEQALQRAQSAISKIEAMGSTLQTPQAIINAGAVTLNGEALNGALNAANDNPMTGAQLPAGFSQEVSQSIEQAVSAIGTGTYKEVGNMVARGAGNVDARLRDILEQAAIRSGYKVEAYSGIRPGDKGFHGKGLATDVKLFDPTSGKLLGGSKHGGHYQTAEGFRDYEKFAQEARRVQMEQYPELNDKFRWGGYFGQAGGERRYGALDGMHFDLGGSRGLGMAGGSWEGGLAPHMRRAYAGIQSQGMGQGIDPQTTGAVQQATQQMQQAGQQMAQAVQPATQAMQQAGQTVQMAGQQVQMGGQQVQMGTQNATQALQQLGTGAQQTGQTTMTTGQQMTQAGEAIRAAGEAAGQGAAAAQQAGLAGIPGLGGAGAMAAGGAGFNGGMTGGMGAMGGMGGLGGILGSLMGGGKAGGGGMGGILGMLMQFLPPPFNMLGGLLGPLFGGMFADGGKVGDKGLMSIFGGILPQLLGGGMGGMGGMGGLFGMLFGGGGESGGSSQMLKMLGGGLLGGEFFADGGRISGPGSGRSDSILAAVSNGEFIVNAKQTKEWEPMLRAINDNKLPKFRDGGKVGGGNVISMGERAMVSGRKGSGSADVAALAEQVTDMSRTMSKALGGRGNVRNNSVNMTVHAKDADSFRRSEGQLLADAQSKISRFGGRNN